MAGPPPPRPAPGAVSVAVQEPSPQSSVHISCGARNSCGISTPEQVGATSTAAHLLGFSMPEVGRSSQLLVQKRGIVSGSVAGLTLTAWLSHSTACGTSVSLMKAVCSGVMPVMWSST